MKYAEAIRALNKAAYDAIRAGRDTTALPGIDRHTLRLIAGETDRLVDYEKNSGEHPSRIEAAGSATDYPVGWMDIASAPKLDEDSPALLLTDGRSVALQSWGENDDGDMAWVPRIRGFLPTHWMPSPDLHKFKA